MRRVAASEIVTRAGGASAGSAARTTSAADLSGGRLAPGLNFSGRSSSNVGVPFEACSRAREPSRSTGPRRRSSSAAGRCRPRPASAPASRRGAGRSRVDRGGEVARRNDRARRLAEPGEQPPFERGQEPAARGRPVGRLGRAPSLRAPRSRPAIREHGRSVDRARDIPGRDVRAFVGVQYDCAQADDLDRKAGRAGGGRKRPGFRPSISDLDPLPRSGVVAAARGRPDRIRLGDRSQRLGRRPRPRPRQRRGRDLGDLRSARRQDAKHKAGSAPDQSSNPVSCSSVSSASRAVCMVEPPVPRPSCGAAASRQSRRGGRVSGPRLPRAPGRKGRRGGGAPLRGYRRK